MITALTVLLPLSLGGAVSPMMLTEQTVLLGSGGRRAANLFALGAVLTLLVIVLLLVFAGQVIALPAEPTLSATLDLVFGLGLLALGSAVYLLGRHRVRWRKGGAGAGEQEGRGPLAGRFRAAFPFGVFSMATNFTTLALVVVAAKEIAAADIAAVERVVLALVVVWICSVPAWAPLATTKMAPRTGQKALDAFHRLIVDHGRTALVALLLAAGAFLIARGLFNV